MNSRRLLRTCARFAIIVVLVAMFAVAARRAGAAGPNAPTGAGVDVQLDSSAATPRQAEDTTEKAIVRDYGNAWSALARALEQNRADLLGASFTGVAQEKLAERIRQQKANGLRTRYVDRGHKLEAIFYSPEGSAMELRDTAKLEIEYLDGETVVGREQVTAHYVALMTVAEDRWKVRLLQAAPE